MNEDLSNHRQNVSCYLDQCLLNYSRWVKTGPRTKSYLLNRYCSTITEISSDYARHLQRFIANNKAYLQNKHPPIVKVQSKPPEKPRILRQEQSVAPPACLKKVVISQPIKKFRAVCSEALTKTLTYLVTETEFKNEAEVATALLNNPKFKQFLTDYANDFYQDLLEDEIIG